MAVIKQISIKQTNGTYVSKDIGATAENVEIDDNNSLADKVLQWDSIINMIADIFDASKSYKINDYCIHNYRLYKCIVEHSGEWNSDHFKETKLINEIGSGGTGEIINIKNIELGNNVTNGIEVDVTETEPEGE